MNYPLIFIEGQMDWPMPGAHVLVLEEPSGTCSYAIVKRANESPENKTTIRVLLGACWLCQTLLIKNNDGWEKGETYLIFLSFLFLFLNFKSQLDTS